MEITYQSQFRVCVCVWACVCVCAFPINWHYEAVITCPLSFECWTLARHVTAREKERGRKMGQILSRLDSLSDSKRKWKDVNVSWFADDATSFRIKSGGMNREITAGWFCHQRTRQSLFSNLLEQIDPQLDLALISTISTTITFFFLINKSFLRSLKSHPLNQGTGNLQLYIMGVYN